MNAHAQTENIQFALNGRNSTDVSKKTFGKFVGEWALKNDHWTHSLTHNKRQDDLNLKKKCNELANI
ncbi:MAG TPA: hypothetical protein DCS93_33715 [Microscillaceae bacterium]|nr:hypothetical protein [Microscillaceae bacterium]